MSAGPAGLVAAFVLHRYPYRDSSFVVETFSAESGRTGLIARGVRRPSSRWRAILQPFCPLLIRWSGRGELGTLAQAESAGPPIALSGEPLMSAFYLNELLLRLLARGDPHAEIFALYGAALQGLQDSNPAPVLRRFEKRLLEALGYGLDFATEADGVTPVEPALRYRVDPQAGPIRDVNGVAGETLLQLAHETFDEHALPEARRILAAAIAPHIGPKPLKTAALLRSLRGLQRNPGENHAATSHSTGR